MRRGIWGIFRRLVEDRKFALRHGFHPVKPEERAWNQRKRPLRHKAKR